jgi:Family of unknown function (DUF6131)
MTGPVCLERDECSVVGDASERRVRDGRVLVYGRPPDGKSEDMIIVGVVLMLLGVVLGIPILWTVGIILLVVGLVLMLLGRSGRRVGGRAHYW